ncbi:MAG: tetratricopeptide repeat protein [Alphaproteobacteria bacterium]|nr:tetratricopeptide repeat protein [Alphaproteobacteria bacterium]
MTPIPSPQIEAALQRAAVLMQRGQWPLAEQVLAQVLQAHPREPDALQLLGRVCASQRRFTEAETLFRQSLAVRPQQPDVQAHLGRLLAATGRNEEAVSLLRAAVRGKPDLFEAFLALAQVQVKAGDFTNAEKDFRSALRLNPESVVALSGLGALLNEMGRPADGETALRTAAEDAACTPVLRARIAHNLGVSLEMQGLYEEALAQFDAALTLVPDQPLTDHNRAKTLAHLGRSEEAVDAFRRAVLRDPMNVEAHKELNALLYRLGRDAEFLASYDEALNRAPEAGALLLQKGGFLIRAERFEEARECFARVAALAPDSAGPQNGLALAFAGLGQLHQSIAAYEKSLTLRPDDLSTKVNLACSLLQAGEAKRALQLTDEVAAKLPFDQSTLAVHELVLRANNDPRAGHLADYERHVQIFDLEPPPGFSSMADFNAALNVHLDTLHTDLREHIDQTLRRGTQTSESLLNSGNELVRALRLRIADAVTDYIARMTDDDDHHPLAGRRTDGFAFAGSWSSRLRDHGFHTNHIHPRGWISSCYYVAVPDAVADETAKQGWIKFGEPSFATALREPVRRAVQPVPGRLVLFPSYMWHGTIPFHSATARTTIAFDAVPT